MVSPAPRSSSRREPLLLRLLREPAPRRETEPELAADRFAEPSAREVLAHRRACRRLPEVALVERGRLLEDGVQPVAPLPRLLELRRGLLVLEVDAEPLGQPLDGLGEVEVLGLADERDHVAALAAAEAVVQLVGRIDGEARRPLLVEGTAAGVAGAGLAQRRPPRDDLHHVGCCDDLPHRCLLDPGHQRRSAYWRAKRSVMPETKARISSSESPRSTRCSKIAEIVACARTCSPRACSPR